MPRKLIQSKTKTRGTVAARAKIGAHARSARPTVSGRWILGALAGVVAAAAMCVWLVLCLLFWQGSWQLLYHPSANVTQNPASASLAFDPIGFATDGAGAAQLSGWWIPAASDSRYSRLTVLYFHGQDGNLSNAVPAISQLHDVGVNVFAFDYRGYGQSKFVRPSEASWIEDAGWALDYLTNTRHIDPHTIVAYGLNLGANLALEFGGAHHELAGVAADTPLKQALTPIFGDERARLVPAHLLVRDRFDLDAAATAIQIPALWFELDVPSVRQSYGEPTAYREITSRKSLVWLAPSDHVDYDRKAEFTRWLDDLGTRN